MHGQGWAAGVRVDQWVVGEQLGAGSMGVVWRGKRLDTGEPVALKTLPRDADKLLLDRFRREVSVLQGLSPHPNVVRVLGHGEALGNHYIVMELVTGGSLDDRLAKGVIPAAEAARLVAGAARGVAHAHRQGVFHRDLKPANVLVAEDGRPVVVDFGVARVRGSEGLTKTGELVGTPAYMAPEQIDSARGVDERSDVYGLGAILYHCLAGQPPFAGDGLASFVKQVLTADPEWPRPARAAAAAWAECRRALSKEKQERHGSAAELAQALERAADGGAARLGPRRLLAPLAALVVAALAAAGGLAWQRASRGPTDDAPAAPAAPGGPAPAVRSVVGDLLRGTKPVGTLEPGSERATTEGWRVSVRCTLSGPITTGAAVRVRGAVVAMRPASEHGARAFQGTVELLPGRNVLEVVPQGDGVPDGPPVTLEVERVALRRRPDGVWLNTKDGSALVEVPAATFTMGTADPVMYEYRDSSGELTKSRLDAGHYTPHQVTISKPFLMGRFEVTWGQLDEFLEDTGSPDLPRMRKLRLTKARKPPNDLELGPTTRDLPACTVSFDLARAYCDWAGVRLPTEAQWELAARGTDGRTFPWVGLDTFTSIDEVARSRANSSFALDPDPTPWLSPVGSFRDGASPYGCLDMAGNVWEWCDDAAVDYTPDPVTDPHRPPEGDDEVVIRGGEWDQGWNELRSWHRGKRERGSVGKGAQGFRVCAPLPGSEAR